MPLLTSWLNYVVKCSGVALSLCITSTAIAQTNQFTLGQALSLAERNYPVLAQRGLAKEKEILALKNINSLLLPQISLNGQASYQSDVTRVDIPIPNVKIPEQQKDQYKVYAGVSQNIYDGGVSRSQRSIQQQNTKVEESRVDVELNSLKLRIANLYFAALYQQQLLKQSTLFVNDIQLGINKVQPQMENGTVLRSNLLVLEAQLLQAQQRQQEIANNIQGLRDALSTLLQTTIADNAEFTSTEITANSDDIIKRPEILLFNNQIQVLQKQKLLVNASNKPRVSAFAQGGYGKPALNLFSPDFESYYIAGLRLNWNFGSLYNASRNKKILNIGQRNLELQRETFEINTRSELSQKSADIRRYTELVQSDEKIIDVRHRITNASKAQLENAVISTNDYLREVNAEDQARQNLIIHQIQLLQAKVLYAITAGKL